MVFVLYNLRLNPLKPVAAKELMCNPGYYDYLARGLFEQWLPFGVVLKVPKASEADKIIQRLQDEGLAYSPGLNGISSAKTVNAHLFAIRLEAIVSRLEAFAIRLEAIAIRCLFFVSSFGDSRSGVFSAAWKVWQNSPFYQTGKAPRRSLPFACIGHLDVFVMRVVVLVFASSFCLRASLCNPQSALCELVQDNAGHCRHLSQLGCTRLAGPRV